MSLTVNYSWDIPDVGADENTWGALVRTLWTDLDTLLGGVNATEFAILDGATVSTAELNKLAGVTWTLTGLNGLTATVTQLNYVDATSSIQTQIDGKQATDATLTAFASLLTAANKIPYATATDTGGELDLQTTITDSDTSVPSSGAVVDYVAANSGRSLIATVATTSGTSVTKSALDFSGYSKIEFVFDGVSVNAAAGSSYLNMKFGSGSYFRVTDAISSSSSNTLDGLMDVAVSQGAFRSIVSESDDTVAGAYGGTFGDVSAETSITWDWSASQSFDAGQILIYGVT